MLLISKIGGNANGKLLLVLCRWAPALGPTHLLTWCKEKLEASCKSLSTRTRWLTYFIQDERRQSTSHIVSRVSSISKRFFFGNHYPDQAPQPLVRWVKLPTGWRWMQCLDSSWQPQQVVENQVSTTHSMRGSGWFYSGYSGFHPNRKELKETKNRKRKQNLKEKIQKW